MSAMPPAAQSRADAAGCDSATPVPAVPPRIADPSALQRVLIVKLGSLGDIAHALPLADALRAALPRTYLGWAVKSGLADLLQGNPNLDAVYRLEGKSIGAVLSLGRTLRAERFDAALDAQGLFVSGVVARLSGVGLRVGLDRNREGNALWLTHPVVPAKGRVHITQALLGFCEALGLPRLSPRPQAYLAQGEAARAEELLADGNAGPRIGFIVGASTPDKAWPQERWAELARLAAAQGAWPILLGGPAEVETASAIMREAGGAVRLDLTGKTPLRVLAATLARCAVVVGGDSGPTHLAVAVGTPVVGLYGVTDPARTGPCWGASPATVLDFNDAAPPETRRPRHNTVPDALSRIPARAAADAALALLRGAA